MDRTDIVIIGAGVVGLSIAHTLSQYNKDIVVMEKHPTFGREASSRNSEVIHAGIYYDKGSLKATLCVEGNALLYEFCSQNNVPHKKVGKLIVATDGKEAREIESLFRQGNENSVSGLKLLSEDEIRELEPNITAVLAIYSPTTGIIDTHQMMKTLESKSAASGVIFAYGCEVLAIERDKDGYILDIRDVDARPMRVCSKVVINSTGLYSDRVAQMIGIDIEKEGYKLHYSKGEYFRVGAPKAGLLNRLIYPVPMKDNLGIHTVVDLQGQLRLGPNAYYVDDIDYDIDEENRDEFFSPARKYLPFLELSDLTPDMSGVRPKLQAKGENERDFIISEETDKGFPGFVNLIGIESPGLTAALAIGRYVSSLLAQKLLIQK